jgi:hypothetical protein
MNEMDFDQSGDMTFKEAELIVWKETGNAICLPLPVPLAGVFPGLTNSPGGG